MLSKLLLLVAAIAGAQAAPASETVVLRAKRDVVQDAPINYNCPPGLILTVQSYDVDNVKMRCREPGFCGQAEAPTSVSGSQCAGEGNFITAITGSPFKSKCVRFRRPDDADDYSENCGTYEIRPKGSQPAAQAPPPGPQSSAPAPPVVPGPVPAGGPPPPAGGNGPPAPPANGAGAPVPVPVPADSKIEVQKEDSKFNTDFPAVKGIEATATGWVVHYCKPNCNKKTTKKPPTTPKNPKPCTSAADCLAQCGSGNGGKGHGGGAGANKRKRDADPEVQGGSCDNGVCSCQHGEGGHHGGNGGGGHGFCFSADSTVTTPAGPMRMDSLKTGNQVLVFNEATGQTSFESVDSFIHRNTQVTTTFVDIVTSAGTKMSLTPGHMVPVVSCHAPSTSQLQAAGTVQPGQCVLVQSDSGHVVPAEISSVSESTKTGIYAPLTKSGNLIVDNTVGSCYSNREGFHAQHSFYRAFLALQSALFGTGFSGVVDVPPILHLINTVSH